MGLFRGKARPLTPLEEKVRALVEKFEKRQLYYLPGADLLKHLIGTEYEREIAPEIEAARAAIRKAAGWMPPMGYDFDLFRHHQGCGTEYIGGARTLQNAKRMAELHKESVLYHLTPCKYDRPGKPPIYGLPYPGPLPKAFKTFGHDGEYYVSSYEDR